MRDPAHGLAVLERLAGLGVRLSVDDAALATLGGMGCDQAQGFGIARPMPADAVPSWVASCSPWRGGSSATRSAAV